MPKVDPMQYLMDALAILTGGLIKDMQTLILGLVVCSFIVMALDMLKDLLLVPALEMAGNFFANPIGAFRRHQINRRISAAVANDEPGQRPSERDEIELSEDRYASLESALDEAEYNERQKRRLHDEAVQDLFRNIGRQ